MEQGQWANKPSNLESVDEAPPVFVLWCIVTMVLIFGCLCVIALLYGQCIVEIEYDVICRRNPTHDEGIVWLLQAVF